MRMISGAILILAAAVLLAAGLVTEQLGRVGKPAQPGLHVTAYIAALVLGVLGVVVTLRRENGKPPPG